MHDATFDAHTHRLGERISRRALGHVARWLGVTAGAVFASPLAAKKKKKKKKKKCAAGLTTCTVKVKKKKKTSCVDASRDRANCGGCGKACGAGQSCIQGVCSGGNNPCSGGQTRCNGACVDTSANARHCGACGQACSSGQGCSRGVCSSTPVLAQWGDGLLHEPRGIAVDSRGVVYVSSNAPDHQVFLFDTDGNPRGTLGEAGGGSGNYRFQDPRGLAVDANDNLYVVDAGNQALKKYDKNGVFQESWTGFLESFDWPQDVAVNSDGVIFIVDPYVNQLQTYDQRNVFPEMAMNEALVTGPWSVAVDDDISVAAGKYAGMGSGHYDLALLFMSVWSYPDYRTNMFSGVTSPRRGIFYGVDNTSASILTFQIGEYDRLEHISTLVGPGLFTSPWAIALDNDSYIYVTDVATGTVQKLAACQDGSCDGEVRCPGRQARCGGACVDLRTSNVHCGACGHGCSASEACHDGQCEGYRAVWQRGSRGRDPGQFVTLFGVAVGDEGSIYVSDAANARIQIFSENGDLLDTWPIDPPEDDPSYPLGISFDNDGNLLVTVYDRHEIRKFTPQGELLATYGSPGRGDGQLSLPRGIAVTAQGDMIVADAGNRRIQRLSSSGAYVTQWSAADVLDVAVTSGGAIYAVFGPMWGGPPHIKIAKYDITGALQTTFPLAGAYTCVDVDGLGNVYAGDMAIKGVRKFTSSGALLTTFGTPGNGPGQFRDINGIALDPQGNVVVTDAHKERLQKFVPVTLAGRESRQQSETENGRRRKRRASGTRDHSDRKPPRSRRPHVNRRRKQRR